MRRRNTLSKGYLGRGHAPPGRVFLGTTSTLDWGQAGRVRRDAGCVSVRLARAPVLAVEPPTPPPIACLGSTRWVWV